MAKGRNLNSSVLSEESGNNADNMSSQIVFIKASIHRKPSKIRDTLVTYAKSIGKISDVRILGVTTIHSGSDNGVSLSVIEALIAFKTLVTLSKIIKTNNVTVLEKKVVPANIPMDVLATMNTSLITSDALDQVKHDLESAIRLYKVSDFSNSAKIFMKIIKLFGNEDNVCAFYNVLVYCRCLALLQLHKVDALQTGYEMLQNLGAEKHKKFPLFYALLNKYEVATRKPVTEYSYKRKDLINWPFGELFDECFPESDPEKADEMLKKVTLFQFLMTFPC